MFKFAPLPLEGCFEITAPRFLDQRGSFFKIFSEKTFFENVGTHLEFREFFTSVSRENVIRGMHFQLPPHDHWKLVGCLSGKVLDIVVDLRYGSPTFGQHAVIELSEENRTLVLIPPGFAHGFGVTEAPATMFYAVETEHSPAHDTGIRWDSFGARWGIQDPIVSERDSKFPRLADFKSPFSYQPSSNKP